MNLRKTVRRAGCACGCPTAGCAGLAALALLMILMLPASCGSASAASTGAECATGSPGGGAGTLSLSGVSGSGAGIGLAVRTSLQPLFPWTPRGGLPTGSWPYGQCTWFVVFEGHLAGSHRVTWGGNADAWYANAQAQGMPTAPPSAIPEPGWIAVFAPGHGSNPELGHVASVLGVQATSATYTIAEMNVLGLGVPDLRTLLLGGTTPLLEGWIE